MSATSNGTTEVWASYLQIYCEQISDLLRDNVQDNIPAIDLTNPAAATHHFHGDAQLNLRIKPDGNGVYVEGLMRYRIASVEDLFDVLERGDQYRSVAATNANEFSSRSHAVLMLSIMIPEESTDPITGMVTIDDRVMREGQLMLVDLAGSERAHASEGRNYLRLEEAKAINLSLSALGNVMNALAENKPHVPYRDSKLTRLLQNCLGGTARTAIIVNVVPGEDATGETLNALRFANRASKVKVVAKISKHRNFEMLYKEALQKIKELEHFKEHALQLSGMEEEMQEKDNLIEKLNLEVQMQKVQINHLQRENEQLKATAKLQAETAQNATTSSGAKILSRTSSSTSLNAGILPPTAPSESGLPPVISPATLALLGHSPGIAAAMNTSKTLASSGVSDTDSIATEEIVTLSSANVTSVTQPQKAEDVAAVEAMSKSMKQKATDLKYKRLTQQVMDAERDLREERERHLRTVQELRAIHDQNISHESYFNKRIDELLQELTERQNLLDEHQQVLQSEREDKAQLEQELTSTKAKMVNMVDKEQVEIMETLFQETIERMNQRVQNLELQAHQQQQQYLQEQQLHLQEKHQWLEAQQQQQARGGKNNVGIKPSVGIAAKTGTSATANGNGAPAKKPSSTYAFWTPEGANALRQQQLKDQSSSSSKDAAGAIKESPRAPTHVRNLSNSSGISQASDSSQELLQGRSALTNTRLEPGGRLRPNSSNSNHLQSSNAGTGSPVTPVQASSSSSNLRASSSAPKTLHSALSPTASTTTAEGSNTSIGVNGLSAGASATTTSPRSSSVTRRSRVVVDPVTGITTTTTTTTTTTNNGPNGGPSNSIPMTSSFRMATPSTPIIGGTEREPLTRKMSLTSLHQAAVASSVVSTPPPAASNAPQFESY